MSWKTLVVLAVLVAGLGGFLIVDNQWLVPKREKAESAKGRLVVLGTSTFASNQALGFQGNRDLFLNIVAWLAGQEDEIAVRPKDPRQNPIYATEAQKNAILWLSMVVIPGAVMVCGIVLVVRRRRSK